MTDRRFPRLWRAPPRCLPSMLSGDANGRRSRETARNEGRRIVVNVARLPELPEKANRVSIGFAGARRAVVKLALFRRAVIAIDKLYSKE
jgi:hypothetical protein